MVILLGGSTYVDKQSLTEWFRSVPNNAVVIKFTLSSIFDLFTEARFPNDTKIEQKFILIQQAFDEYLNRTSTVYCENKCTSPVHGTCQSQDAYGYGLCTCNYGYEGFDCSKTYPTTPAPTIPPTTLVPPV